MPHGHTESKRVVSLFDAGIRDGASGSGNTDAIRNGGNSLCRLLWKLGAPRFPSPRSGLGAR